MKLTVPTIAFFGTKGGVGKTTIMDKFATLISRAPTSPRVLLVDFDVYHRGLTILRTGDRIADCVTVHQYLADPGLTFAGARDVTPANDSASGRQFLIPSSRLAADEVYGTVSRFGYKDLLARIQAVIEAAVEKHKIDIVIIDCGPIVDPLTASAAYLSDPSFIIGQNEPISYQALTNYSQRIQEFFSDFDAGSVCIIINKVRGVVRGRSAFAAIPFAIEVIDYSEGLLHIDDIRLTFFDSFVLEMIEKLFKDRYPALVPTPDAIFTHEQHEVFEAVDRYPIARWFRRVKALSWTLPVGCAALVAGAYLSFFTDSLVRTRWESVASIALWIIGIGFLVIGGWAIWIYLTAGRIMRLKRNRGYAGFVHLLGSKTGRRLIERVYAFSGRR